jgi:hypothetical protein
MEREWFILDRFNQSKGPYTIKEVAALSKTHKLLVCRGNAQDWKPADAFPEIIDYRPAGKLYVLGPSRPAHIAAPLDSDAQPAIEALNARQNLRMAMNELIGLCKGFMADNHLSDGEIRYIEGWFTTHAHVVKEWPANVIADRVRQVLVDGVITNEERADLKEILGMAIGKPPPAETAANRSTRLPIEVPEPPIVFWQMNFCLTGKFIYGSRSKSEQAVTERGGLCQSQPTTETNYVVIGTLPSRDWAHGSYGRKIEAAVRLKESGHAVRIVSEDHWVRYVKDPALCQRSGAPS